MKREEHKAIIDKLMKMIPAEHQADASEALTQLSDDYSETLETVDTLNGRVTTLTGNNERLRSVNAELFLKVGSTIGKENGKEAPEKKEEGEPLPFDDLFNEKGELK